jgi:hypothetical protein
VLHAALLHWVALLAPLLWHQVLLHHWWTAQVLLPHQLM